MRDIYGCADLTIIAAAGGDSSAGGDSWAGLPGLRPNTRESGQITCVVDGISLGNVPSSSPSEKLAKSYGQTRAWTLQESTHSNRILIFTEEEIAFDCNQKSAWREGFALELVPDMWRKARRYKHTWY
jgi:hypothetical protein